MTTSWTAGPEFRCLKICSTFKKMRNDKYFDELSLKPGHFCSASCILIRPLCSNEFAFGGGCQGRQPGASGFARGWNPKMTVVVGSAKALPAAGPGWRTREAEPAAGRTRRIKVNQIFPCVEIFFLVPKQNGNIYVQAKFSAKWKSDKMLLQVNQNFLLLWNQSILVQVCPFKACRCVFVWNNNNELHVGKKSFPNENWKNSIPEMFTWATSTLWECFVLGQKVLETKYCQNWQFFQNTVNKSKMALFT